MRTPQKNLFEYFETTRGVRGDHTTNRRLKNRITLKKRYARTKHGGVPTKGRRKLERPLSTKKWIHLVLKSDKAKRMMSFLSAKNKTVVEGILREKAAKFGVKIDKMVNVGNHIHLKIKIASRTGFQGFLRSSTTLVARKVTGAKRGRPFGRFWQGQAFTRVLTSRLEELNLRGYLKANEIEAVVSSAAREAYLKKFNKWVYQDCGKSTATTAFASSE